METATISVSYVIFRLTDLLLFPEVPFDSKLFLEHDEIDLMDEGGWGSDHLQKYAMMSIKKTNAS